jgi:formylglycine-generating enzyme required for sulfatase activity
LEIDLELIPLPGQVEIISQPEGARVYINGQDYGETPLSLTDLPVDKSLNIELVKEGFREKAQSFKLKPNANLLLDFGNLIMKTGEIRPTVLVDTGVPEEELLEDLIYVVDGVSFYGTSKILSPVMEGEHTLRVEHPDYFPAQVDLRVGDGRFTPVSIDLVPKPGQLTVKLSPPLNFELMANGATVEPINGAGTTFSLPPNQEFDLEIKIRDHLSARKVVTFDPNQREVWNLKAVPIPGPEPGKDYLAPYVGIELGFIPEGIFTMGSPNTEVGRLPEEGPLTRMEISKPFWIGIYEIKQSEYLYIMEDNPRRFEGGENPVDSVSWKDAVQFCNRLTVIERQAGRLPEGYVYRLPTEAEWEYAARAQTDTPFFWGDEADPDAGNFKGVYPRDFNEDLEISGIYGSVQAGKYSPNNWGLYDMHGNVREWALDNWNARLPGGSSRDYSGPDSGRKKSYRGGGWEDPAKLCRSAVREGLRPSTISSSLGFRIVLGPEVN